MEDFVTWVDTSKLKRTVMRYNDEVRAAVLRCHPCLLTVFPSYSARRLRPPLVRAALGFQGAPSIAVIRASDARKAQPLHAGLQWGNIAALHGDWETRSATRQSLINASRCVSRQADPSHSHRNTAWRYLSTPSSVVFGISLFCFLDPLLIIMLILESLNCYSSYSLEQQKKSLSVLFRATRFGSQRHAKQVQIW